MVTPVWENALLNLFVQAFLHTVHVFELVRLHTLVILAVSALNRSLEA